MAGRFMPLDLCRRTAAMMARAGRGCGSPPFGVASPVLERFRTSDCDARRPASTSGAVGDECNIDSRWLSSCGFALQTTVERFSSIEARRWVVVCAFEEWSSAGELAALSCRFVTPTTENRLIWDKTGICQTSAADVSWVPPDPEV